MIICRPIRVVNQMNTDEDFRWQTPVSQDLPRLSGNTDFTHNKAHGFDHCPSRRVADPTRAISTNFSPPADPGGAEEEAGDRPGPALRVLSFFPSGPVNSGATFLPSERHHENQEQNKRLPSVNFLSD